MKKALQAYEWMAPGANLAAYMQGVNSIAVLSVEQERSLAEDLYYREDLDAARRLVLLSLDDSHSHRQSIRGLDRRNLGRFVRPCPV